MKINIRNLDSYGLTKEQLVLLGNREIQVRVTIPISPYVYPSKPVYKRLLALTPSARNKLQRDWMNKKFKNLCKEFPIENYEMYILDSVAYGVIDRLPAKDFSKLLSLKHAAQIDIEGIIGRHPKKDKPDKRWYSVKARMSWQSEDQNKGMQYYDDIILLVQAYSEESARKKAEKNLGMQSPSLMSDGRFFCIVLEQIIEVYDPTIWEIEAEGTEIYSVLRRRRMKLSYEWHPRKVEKMSKSINARPKKA